MKEKNQSITALFKRHTIIIVSLLTVSIITVFILLFINIQSNYDEPTTRIMTLAAIAMVIILFTLICIFLASTYKNLVIPITQLYKGMGDVGINGVDIVTPVVKNQELIPMYSEVRTLFRKLNSLLSLMENLNKNIPFKDILNYIFTSFSEYIPYTYIGVALVEDNGKYIKASYGVTGKYHKNLPKKILGYKIKLNMTSLENLLKTGEVRVINDLEEYVKDKPLKEYNKILLEEGIKSSITYPLINNEEAVGIIFFSSSSKNVYNEEHIKFLKILANSIMLSLEEDILIDDMVIGSTLALATLTEERDTETGQHLDRMKKYARLLSELLSKENKYIDIIDMDYINNIERFSPIHDIGKVAIKDEILLKPGKLTEEEFEIMKTHALYGGRVLRMADKNVKKRGRSIFKIGIEIAEGHHEKWDGSGYPNGKIGEEIPLSARIVAVADVFDALTSDRPYKKAFSFEGSVSIIEKGAGTQFDPYIVDVFLSNINIIKSMYLSFKENKEEN